MQGSQPRERLFTTRRQRVSAVQNACGVGSRAQQPRSGTACRRKQRGALLWRQCDVGGCFFPDRGGVVGDPFGQSHG
jgi:hypothetical protein